MKSGGPNRVFTFSLSEKIFSILSQSNEIVGDSITIGFETSSGSGCFLNGPIHPQTKVTIDTSAINSLIIIKADSLDQY